MMENNEQAKDQQQIQTEIHRIIKNKQQQSVQDNQNKYVAPYQSENATRVARYLSPFEGDRSQALQQLPNFETALSIAKTKLICMEAKINHIMIIQ